MKPESCWILQEIAGTPYILPYGQAIADLRHGLRINETCAFLWKQLQTDPTREELLKAFAVRYQATADELPQLATDLDEFLAQLTACGILRPEPDTGKELSVANSSPASQSDSKQLCSNDNPAADTEVHFLRIGGLMLRLVGPDSAFAPEFAPFFCMPEKPIDLTIEVLADTEASADQTIESLSPISSAAGPKPCSTLIRHPQLIVQDCGPEYFLYFPQAPQIRECRLKKDGSAARFFCALPLEEPSVTDLFHAIRIAYLYLAQKKGVFALHSASILYQGKAWLFSGQSGTGKSTHTELWNRLFGTPILNGDLNLLTIRDGAPVVCGLPWCGTSGISTVKDYPLGGIILLKQARHNLCLKPGADRQQLLLAQRFISPTWTSDQLQDNLRFAGKLAALAPVRILSCTKEDAAAVYMKEIIDSFKNP